jgi:hypothetical protein
MAGSPTVAWGVFPSLRTRGSNLLLGVSGAVGAGLAPSIGRAGG